MVVSFLRKISTMLLAESPSSLPGRLGALEAVEDRSTATTMTTTTSAMPPMPSHVHRRRRLRWVLAACFQTFRGMGRCWTK